MGAATQEAYVWRNVKVGGGFIPGVVFSPVEPGLAYARSDMGGAYRFDRAAGRWIPLQDGEPESSYFGVESIAPDPNDAEVVYAAVGMGRQGPAAILRSSNRGETWEQHSVPFRMGGNEGGRGLGERLAVDPGDSAIIYFGSRHDGLQQSRDAGRTETGVILSAPRAWFRTKAQPWRALLSLIRRAARGRASQRFFGVADPVRRRY